MGRELVIETPRWALPLLPPRRYKGAKGGRGSGKSHNFAEMLVEEHIYQPNQMSVCIREIQKSLKFSAKKLIETKIREMGVSHLFDITLNEIRRIGVGANDGLMIFQGMQDHTADSIKSLEGFDRAWYEEAQNASARSLELLLPTIRKDGSEIWFSWNPDQPDDPVEVLFKSMDEDDGVCVHVNFDQNPFCPQTLRKEAARHYKYNPDSYGHIWLGEYNVKREAIIFNGKYQIREFEPLPGWQPLHGLDWGFSQDPLAAVRCYFADERLFVYKEAGGVGIELDETADLLARKIEGVAGYTIRADNARPESISFCRRNGLPKITSVDKWPGSVEDGISYIRALKEVVIHPQCTNVAEEFRLYSYKVHKQTGEILPDIVDKHNHYIDAIRYALAPLIKSGRSRVHIG